MTNQSRIVEPAVAAAPTHATARRPVVEAHSIDYIPERERRGNMVQQTLFWFIPNLTIFSVALGVIGPSLGLSLWWTILAGAVGSIFGGFFVSFHAAQGPKLGLPQMIQSRAQFGYRGVIIPTLVVLVNYMVFNVLQTDVIKSGLNSIFGWDRTLVIIGISAIAAILAILGHDWLHRAYRVLFWVSTPLFVILTIGIAVGGAGGGGATVELGFTLSAFMAVVAAAVAYQLALAPYVSDYTRYLPATTKTSRIVLSMQIGICVSLIWFMGLGAWLASELGATDVVAGINDAGNAMFPEFGTITAVLAVLALVAVIGTNTYSGALAVITVVDTARPIVPTRKLRIGIILALFAVWVTINILLVTDQTVLITNLLNIMLYLLVPWSAVNLVDFFLVRKGHYAITEIMRRNGIYGDWAWRGIAAYFIGLAFEVPFMSFSFYQGPFMQLIGFDISFLLGLVASGGAYLLFSRSLKVQSEAAAIARSDSLLERLPPTQ